MIIDIRKLVQTSKFAMRLQNHEVSVIRAVQKEAVLYAPPGALIKYQIATYLCCNPQDASYEVEESSWDLR